MSCCSRVQFPGLPRRLRSLWTLLGPSRWSPFRIDIEGQQRAKTCGKRRLGVRSSLRISEWTLLGVRIGRERRGRGLYWGQVRWFKWV